MEQAEAETGCRFITAFAERSDNYDLAIWKGALTFSVGTGFLLLLLQNLAHWPKAPTTLWWFSCVFVMGILGAILVSQSKGLKRFFVGETTLLKRVEDKAHALFHEHGLHQVEAQMSILLFVSYLEKRVVILVDENLRHQLPAAQWEGITAHVLDSMDNRVKSIPLICAIKESASLLKQHQIDGTSPAL